MVDLISIGLEFDDAWRQVDPDAKKEIGTSRDREAAVADAKRVEEPLLGDDEWFEQNCGEKAGMLGNPARFKADALLYRRISEARHLFRVAVKKALKDAKKARGTSPLYNAVNRIISLSHPKDWYLCDGCRGQGIGEDGGPCKTCFGACYRLRTEEYL